MNFCHPKREARFPGQETVASSPWPDRVERIPENRTGFAVKKGNLLFPGSGFCVAMLVNPSDFIFCQYMITYAYPGKMSEQVSRMERSAPAVHIDELKMLIKRRADYMERTRSAQDE